MRRLKEMLNKRRRLAFGIQLAMTMFASTKGAAASKAPAAPKPQAAIDQTAKFDFSKLIAAGNHPELLREVEEKRRNAQEMASATWNLAVKTASDAILPHSGGAAQTLSNAFRAPQLTHEQARLWLQSFNAGPYALLRYKGDVPYRETQNYYPRVMKYYQQNLSNSPYEPYIQKSAAKYGLDPQFVRAIMKTESDFRNSTVSSAGARGLMQVMPVVWSEIKKKYDLPWDYNSGVFEPEKNIEVACAYLAWLKYDFLPRHFAVFEKDPEAPPVLVRDKDRGVPDRPTPRIATAVAANTPVTPPGPDVAPPISPEAIATATAVAAAVPAAQSGQQVASAPATVPQKPKPDAGAEQKRQPKQVAAAEKRDQKPQSKQVAAAEKPERKQVAVASRKTTPPPLARDTSTRAKGSDAAAPAVDEGKDKVQIAFVSDKTSKKVTTRTHGGKTVVSIRPDKASVAKKPAVAGAAVKSVASSDKDKGLKPNHRALKKPSMASAESNREEERRS